MIRTLIAAALALLANPAIADTIPIVDGPLTVHNGDILVTSKPLVGKVVSGAMSQAAGSNWINRVDGKPFTLSGGATRLGIITAPAVGYALNGFTYQVMDGASAVVTPPVVTAPVAPPAPPAPVGLLYGIGLSGGEFHGASDGRFLPTPADMAAYYAVGYRMFRIPFVTAELDNSAPKLIALANECITLKVPCMFDRHEFSWPAVADQIAYWVKVDGILPKSDYVQFDLMNETNLKLWDQWATDQQAIVTGIRAAGVAHFMWLEYPGSSAVFRFDKGKRTTGSCDSAACALVKLPGGMIQDPLHKIGFSGHRYFDSASSGGSNVCSTSVNILDFANKALPFGVPVEVGEYAFGNDASISATCAKLAPQIMSEIKAAPNLYGVTLYGGGYNLGVVWGSYMFRAKPLATSPYIQMTTGKTAP